MSPSPQNLFPVIDASEVSLNADAPIRRAMEILDQSIAKIALVIDEKGKIVGSITDGDVRRALLKGLTLSSSVDQAMHKNPYMLPANTPRQRLLEIMRAQDIRQIPLVHDEGGIAGVAVYNMLSGLNYPPRSNKVVIMAGGKGKRLLPLTSDRPKPMVTIGGKPILEWILQRFMHYGFSDFVFAVNHLGHMIEDYFGDGHTFGCRISYLREKEALGTAGALSLWKQTPKEPFIVINGDILASLDFAELVDRHNASNSIATVCARTHRSEVPYGVIQLDKNGALETIMEKPVHEDLVSAGIYVLNTEALSHIPANQPTDMPSVLLSLVKDRKKVSVFPLQEEWVDVGRHDDLERAGHAFLQKAAGSI